MIYYISALILSILYIGVWFYFSKQTSKSIAPIRVFFSELEKITQGLRYWTFHSFNELKAKSIDPPWTPPILKIFPVKRINIDLIDRYKAEFVTLDQTRSVFNKTFIHNEAVICASLFQRVNGLPLTEKQREAVIIDEFRHLVVAGAGTGKTSTLVTKIVYLTERLGVNPSRILALSFTKVAVDEMRQRLKAITGKEITVRTISSFGLNVIRELAGNISKVSEKAPEQRDSSEFGKFFETEISKNVSDLVYQGEFVEFLMVHLPFPKTTDEYRKESEQIRATQKELALDGNIYRSNEEIIIANFLYLHGVNYEYEKCYTTNDGTEYENYKPDFYLKDYGIWIEHFALINERGDVPPFFSGQGRKSASQLYNEQRNWKLKFHKANGTLLIQTFSFQVKYGTLLKELGKSLSSHGIKLKNPEEVFIRLKESSSFKNMITLISTFITLIKSCSLSVDDLREKISKNKLGRRYEVFVNLIEPLLIGYEEYLRINNLIDFSDMVNKATDFIIEEKPDLAIDYILIDEFQDLSVGQMRLIKAILQNNPSIKLFGVGDDWQSIYRFAGVDVSMMTNFENYFGKAEITRLETTFRFSQEIADASSNFVMANPSQIKKNITSTKTQINGSIKLVSVYPDYFYSKPGSSLPVNDPLNYILDEIHKTRGDNKTSILILGRFKTDIQHLIQPVFRKYHKYDIAYRTVHAAKGAEADFTILWNVNGNTFPCSKEDDPVLNLVLAQNDEIMNAEERRLFYVALTRTKNIVYVLYTVNNLSPFIEEMQGIYVNYQSCPSPDCNGILVTRINNKDNSIFLGCSNFPQCKQTRSVPTQNNVMKFEKWNVTKPQPNGSLVCIKQRTS